MLRAAPIAALLAGLILAVPSTAQVGSGKIAFSRALDAPGIFTANPDGSGVTMIRPHSIMPTWSPDGSQIAFREANRLYVMNADSSDGRPVSGPLSEFSNPAWSPDSTRIAYAGSETRDSRTYNDLFVVDLAGGAPRRLTFDGTLIRGPAWSPTDSRIVYSARVPASSSGPHLFVVDANGGTPKQITGNTGELAYDFSPTWSPDGRTIAFIRTVGIRSSVYIVRSDGTDLHQVADVIENLSDGLAWSPDGTKIAFSTAVNAGFAFNGRAGREIYVAHTDGSAERRLTHGGPLFMTDWNPVWSPDGDRLLFLRRHDAGRSGIYTMNSDGTCEGWITVGETPSWQPLPGMPSLGPRRCHALAVDGEAPFEVPGSMATITATVVNDGTEPVTGIELVASGSRDVAFSSAEMPPGEGSCRVGPAVVTCRIPRLERGGSAPISIQATGQRVTSVVDPRLDVGLEVTLSVGAAETLLPTHREFVEVRFSLGRCTTGIRGGGRVVGTQYRDQLCGRRGADLITPLGHGDTVAAGSGNDLVFARDGLRDVIRCGPGRDRVVVDRLDFVGRDCERVSRRRVKRPPPYGP